jgi:hypothetical protein
MFALFRPIIDRLKALFATSAALEIEAQFLARDAERKAELLRLAAHYENQGLHSIAEQLRHQADTLSFHQPLASVLPAVEHLHADKPGGLKLFTPPADNPEVQHDPVREKNILPLPQRRKKGEKS